MGLLGRAAGRLLPLLQPTNAWPHRGGALRVQEGSKPIFHLEAFIAQFMSSYKKWALLAYGD